MISPYFITFEGIEGSGKTTQNQRCADYLKNQNFPVLQTREPGGTELGVSLRQFILDPNQVFASPYTELLLFYADRMEHVESKIKPALNEGKIVLCDRYIDSTFAYQEGGRGMPEHLITTLNNHVNLMPTLTFLLDLPVEEGLKRAKARADLDRFEHENVMFHRRVRAAYLKQVQKDPNRIKIIEVEGLSQDEVFGKIKGYLDKLF
jgi:dTMP kinase